MGTTSIIMLVLLAQVLPGTPPPPDKVKAQGLISEGAILYEKGDYTSALDQFQAAYAAYPSARIWFNIGQTNRDLGRPVEALEAFQKFLDGVPDASPEDKADAQSSMADLQKRLGQLTIVCDAKGAEISVDGKPMGTAPLAKPVWAIPGLHQVLALQKDAAPAVESVKVNEGANTALYSTIFTSADSGATWTQRATPELLGWIASSADGTKLLAGSLYLSTDSGTSWNEVTNPTALQSSSGRASSADGTKLIVATSGGLIYISTDSGATWTPRATSQQWNGVASSADGTKLVAVVSGGYIYTSSGPVP